MDSGGQNKAYKKKIGIHSSDIVAHRNKINFYRNVVRLVDEIRLLIKNKKGNEEKLEELREELKAILEG